MTKDYIAIANKYISDVLSKKVIACDFVKQACKRQKADLKKKRWPYTFDEKRAIKPCKFIELLKHIKGPLAGEYIELQPWQIFIITTVFGWIDKNGNRRYQQVYIEVPRGNGKSALSSGIGLYCLCADDEIGADVYSFATTRDQAKIVFGDAQQMTRNNKTLQSAYGLQVLANGLVVLGTGSKFQAKSADGKTLDGLNTHCGIIDELHAHKTSEVYDVVKTSIGKRAQPLLWCITTAGFNLTGVCMTVRQYISKILRGNVKDETNFGIIYTIDESDDWTTEEALKKANPNWGISVQPKAILSNLSMALSDPSQESNYKTKHLDVWCNADCPFLDMNKYRKCYCPEVDISEFQGWPCIYGLDLAAKTDITALVRLFWREEDGVIHYYIFPEFWLPSDKIQSKANTHYIGWAKQDLIHVSDGAINDIDAIQRYIENDVKQYDTLAIAFDPWQTYQMASSLQNDGVNMVEIKPTVANFSEAMKEMQSLFYQKRLHTDGNPVMEWMGANLVAHTDAKDNVYPRKESPEQKIDGMVALIMCIKQAIFMSVETEYLGKADISFGDLIL